MSGSAQPRSPREALAGIPGFTGARVAERLSDGPTNASYRVVRGGEDFVLRLDKPRAAQLGLNRVNEQRVNAAVFAAGVGPEPLHSDPQGGVLLRRFVAGKAWALRDLQDPGNLERLGRLLRRLHDLPAHAEDFDPLEAARRYADELGTPEAGALVREARRRYSEIPAAVPALCHNDLVCENIVEPGEGSLLLIDWEYAGLGDPFFDLGVVVQHHGLDDSLADRLLNAWLGRPVRAGDRQHLEAQCRFYASLLALWNLVTGVA